MVNVPLPNVVNEGLRLSERGFVGHGVLEGSHRVAAHHGQLHGSPAQPVDFARAQVQKRPGVDRRAVALVAGETVAGVQAVHLTHQPVAGDLGQDRCRGDGLGLAIPAHHGLHLAGQLEAVVAVHQGEDGRYGERLRLVIGAGRGALDGDENRHRPELQERGCG